MGLVSWPLWTWDLSSASERERENMFGPRVFEFICCGGSVAIGFIWQFHWKAFLEERGSGTKICLRGRVEGVLAVLNFISIWEGSYPPLGTQAIPSIIFLFLLYDNTIKHLSRNEFAQAGLVWDRFQWQQQPEDAREIDEISMRAQLPKWLWPILFAKQQSNA